ncbi:MAG: redox-sensing transcriptional repressor Rex [Bacteroidales bacterium]|nr:redox-sensing transcriptional repressor Rex [Bacteroidales bacterium]MBR2475808.1 redox-sensing transcriptional repressor Rex [Bacteroidaceae bacterium]MBR3608913.1 redox-sensing transcriptional repressor Rex [Bacteroidales bacterium]
MILPEPSLRRLPWYLAHVKLLMENSVEFVSSTQIAAATNVDASQVAKDLSMLEISGKTRVGYEVASLVEVLEDFLGFTKCHKACIFGVGSLGGALMHDSGLEQYGLKLVAGFDVRSDIVGKEINGIKIYNISEFEEIQKKEQMVIGIITVPVDKAQESADIMVSGGIGAIWNFTPYKIKVDESVVVQETSLYAHLAVMFNRLNEK